MDFMDIYDRFVPIPGHPYHGVNAKGEVYSYITEKLLKPDIVNGYYRVTIGKEKIYIHKLVAEVFIPNPTNRKFVIHRDYNKLNNFYLNLRWASKSETQRPHGYGYSKFSL